MNTLTVSRHKGELLERATEYHHAKIWVPGIRSYLEGFLHEPQKGVSAYQSGDEPIVDQEGLYDLDASNAWLTVNQYNALVLNTSNMLIADIDFGDPRINRFAGARNCDDVIENLSDLAFFDEHYFGLDDPDVGTDDFRFANDFRFAQQTYRVYRTHSGCRVICTSATMPWKEMGWLAERFMRFLRGDPNYIELCQVQKCYRARLTPKPWRDNGEPVHVCRLEQVQFLGGSDEVHPDLKEQLRLHDELTLPENEWSKLA
jgi:hypothetical protein